MDNRRKDVWKLLRVGDSCKVYDNGVEFCGRIVRIIRLSKGDTLFVVDSYKGMALGIYDASLVVPRDDRMSDLNLTSYELQILRLEPKGMSTASTQTY